MFLNPQIKTKPIPDDAVVVGAVLAYELGRARRSGTGDGKGSRDVAVPIGLRGPMRGISAGPDLTDHLSAISDDFSSFQHSAINLDAGRRRADCASASGRRRADAAGRAFDHGRSPTGKYPARVTRVAAGTTRFADLSVRTRRSSTARIRC